uniref:Zinc finger protein 131 n=1 Tax=Gorilla gorilla gorilla TaxID=9595 RepID=A0A2I2ZAH2_GORGO
MEVEERMKYQDWFTDIILIVNRHHFKAHKALLAACSKFFYKFLQFTQERLVEIEVVCKMTFCNLIQFTYTFLPMKGSGKISCFIMKALEVRNKENSAPLEENTTRKKIAATSNVITESLPSAESEPVEIEIEIAEDEGIKTLEEVDSYTQNTSSSNDSALALLADITSKYHQSDRKGQIKEEDGHASDPTSIQERMKSHSTESFKCEICNERYLWESTWKQHLNCYHLEEGGVTKKQRTGKKVYVCQYCEKQFDCSGHFKEHLRKHTGEKPFECPNCHERFARNSTLKCHLTACQTGVEKLYKCHVCNSVFNSWDQFKDHLVIHTGCKPNYCSLCDLWFMQGSKLMRHLSDTISERLVMEEVLSVETCVRVLPLLQVQVDSAQVTVDSAQVTVEHVHPDLLQDSQVLCSHMSVLPEQVQISYLEVGRIQTEEGTEVHVEKLHFEWINQVPVEVQTELLEADLDHVTPEIYEPREERTYKPTVDSEAEKAENEDRTAMLVLE